jgi:hypothetical protein
MDYAFKHRARAGNPDDWSAHIEQIAEVRTAKL